MIDSWFAPDIEREMFEVWIGDLQFLMVLDYLQA